MLDCFSSALRWKAVAAWVLLVSATVVLFGCTTEKRYKVLSFFFDGVPDPNAAAQGGVASQVRRSGTGTVYFVHKPYSDGTCQDCHKSEQGTFFTPQAVRADICMDCHKNVADQYPVMHGPVTSNACNWCHSPHQAPNKNLLKAGGEKVCLQCHEADGLSPNPPQHREPNVDCLICHSGHGGKTKAMLRIAQAEEPKPAEGEVKQ